MPKGTIEHANLVVTDIERSSHLFQKLCGWHERWRGPSMGGGETIHVGNESSYIAFYTNGHARGGYSTGVPLSHVGLLVDDLGEAEKIIVEAGLKPWGHDDYEPGRRFYFYDWDGIEFEVVSYE